MLPFAQMIQKTLQIYLKNALNTFILGKMKLLSYSFDVKMALRPHNSTHLKPKLYNIVQKNAQTPPKTAKITYILCQID
jgi:hypothetical protein